MPMYFFLLGFLGIIIVGFCFVLGGFVGTNVNGITFFILNLIIYPINSLTDLYVLISPVSCNPARTTY